jgi:hypothetical protein
VHGSHLSVERRRIGDLGRASGPHHRLPVRAERQSGVGSVAQSGALGTRPRRPGGELWRYQDGASSTLPRVSASETLQVQPRPHSQSAHMHRSLAQTPRLMAPLNASFFSGGPPGTIGSADAGAACSQSCTAW